MATINFYLKEPNSKELSLIYAMVSANGNRYKLSTGEKIKPKDWDSAKHKSKTNRDGSTELNARLKAYEANLESAYSAMLTEIINGTEYAQSQIIANLKLALNLNKPTKKKDLLDIFDSFQEEKALQVKELTLKKYKTLKKHLIEFSEKKRWKLEFQLLDEKFDIAFRNFLHNDLKLLNDTVSKYYDCLKVFLTWANERGYTKTMFYKGFKAKRSKTDIIFLTEPELMTLHNMDLTNNARLCRIRDLFCFQCFTGQRFSDITNLKWSDIKQGEDGQEWHLYQVKGNKTNKVVVPLSPFAMDILNNQPKKEKAISKVFPVITSQKANIYIKELCEKAEIMELTTTVKYSGKKRVETVDPKYRFISTHTARRTFITLSLEKKMEPHILQEITGHEDYRSMKKYIKVTEKVKSKALHSVWSKDPIY